jgi:hypothetical protein
MQLVLAFFCILAGSLPVPRRWNCGAREPSGPDSELFDLVSMKSISRLGNYARMVLNCWVMPLSTDALPNGSAYTFPVAENGGILSVVLLPTRQWTINGSIEASFADAGYTQIRPAGASALSYPYTLQTKGMGHHFLDLQRSRKKKQRFVLVNHLDHSRSLALAATFMPNQRCGLDLRHG